MSVPDLSPGRPRVYIVEDEKSVAALLESALLDAGYEVFVSYGADDALRDVEELDLPVDLFIIDVVLPAMSGPDLAHQLLRRVPDAALLYISGHGEGAAAALRRGNAGARFLPKPFDLDEVLAEVRSALDG